VKLTLQLHNKVVKDSWVCLKGFTAKLLKGFKEKMENEETEP